MCPCTIFHWWQQMIEGVCIFCLVSKHHVTWLKKKKAARSDSICYRMTMCRLKCIQYRFISCCYRFLLDHCAKHSITSWASLATKSIQQDIWSSVQGHKDPEILLGQRDREFPSLSRQTKRGGRAEMKAEHMLRSEDSDQYEMSEAVAWSSLIQWQQWKVRSRLAAPHSSLWKSDFCEAFVSASMAPFWNVSFF